MPANDVKFLLRIPVELDAQLRQQAEAEGRSLNQLILLILADGVGQKHQATPESKMAAGHYYPPADPEAESDMEMDRRLRG